LWQTEREREREREKHTHTVFVKDFGGCETNFLILGDDQFCGVGPNLHGLFGMTSGTTLGFTYSTAYKNKDVFVWTEENIYDYLLNPKKVREDLSVWIAISQGRRKVPEGGRHIV
jgi:cytochrome c2